MRNFEELQEFIRANGNWKRLLRLPPYNLKAVTDCPWPGHENWTMLVYSLFDSDLRNPIVRQCRGTIVDGEGNVVCAPYIKFFNYGDSNCPELEGKLFINEKLDGQLVKAFKYKGDLFWVSNGGWDVNALGEEGTNVFKRALGSAELIDSNWSDCIPDGYTLMFELCSSDNKIICKYGAPELWLHGVRNADGDELDAYEFVAANHLPFRVPYLFDFETLDEAIATINTWDGEHHEGIVVRDANYNRVKVKCDDYLRIKFAKLLTTPKKIYNVWSEGEWDDLVKNQKVMAKIHELDDEINNLSFKVVKAYNIMSDLNVECDSRKIFADRVRKLVELGKIEKWEATLAFAAYGRPLDMFIGNFKQWQLTGSWKKYNTWKERLKSYSL